MVGDGLAIADTPRDKHTRIHRKHLHGDIECLWTECCRKCGIYVWHRMCHLTNAISHRSSVPHTRFQVQSVALSQRRVQTRSRHAKSTTLKGQHTPISTRLSAQMVADTGHQHRTSCWRMDPLSSITRLIITITPRACKYLHPRTLQVMLEGAAECTARARARLMEA